jgi:hypothetical protein
VFLISACVAGLGAVLVRKGFTYPIPRDESIEEQIGTPDDDVPPAPSEEVDEIPVSVPVEVPAARQTKVEEVRD